MAFRNHHHEFDPVWHVQFIVLLVLLLQLALPDKLAAGPRYLLPALEAALLLGLMLTTPKEPIFRSIGRRLNAVTLIALVSAANVYSLSRVTNALLAGGQIQNGRELILASINIYLTNIVAFALWYWEIDGGGPGKRRALKPHEKDFLFPQQSSPQATSPNWHPTFIDYLYVSATNATAFSPTDTMPLTRRSKMLMLVQAVVSLVTIAMVAARAVNILS